MTQPLPWEKNTAVPVPPAPEPVPLDAYTAPAAPEPELVPLDIYDAPAPAPKPAKPLVDIDSLNPAQREAVLTTEGPLLVLAGAGSGKTRVLTFRIAHMLGDLGVKPWQILAITFTNKAAAEMRERLAALIPNGTRGMWVCTFHAMCVRMLREDADLLGYTGQFTIYDDDDSKRMVRDIMQALGIEQKQFPINMIRSKISSAKNAMIGPEDMLKSADSPNDKKAAQVYMELERRLRAANAMDFDDLLVRTLELLRTRPEVLDKYQERFRYISVDEYQDTNHVQYEIANLLAAKYQNLMVVGDDDQSIYSWRGADITNILDFEKDFKNCKTVKLEQNYRSTGHILSAANAVVRHNSQRKEKRLFTAEGDGEKIQAFQASDERDEGRWIAGEIEKLHSKGTSYDDIAVFYRTNAQSRILEDMFLRAGVPYKIVGGTRFFDRAEIRDVMAYLTLIVNPADDIAATVRSYGGMPFHGICCGDIVSHDHSLYGRYNEVMERTGITFRNAMGNHDMKVYGRSYETSFSKFEQMYGPVYYSFDVGRIHYVVLDDNFFIGRDYFYIGYLEERQMRWLEKDLARVQPGSTVVVCLHIPSTCEEQDRKQFRYDRAGSTMTNHRGLYEILKPYRAHIISGHTHTTFNQSIAPGLYEHVTPALSGAWWQGPLCTDGTPAGYGVYEVNGDRIDWYYKSTGYPADYQMKIYSGREYPQFEGYAVANVWASDPAWEVQFTIDGVPCGPAERFQAYDPAAKQMYSDTSQMDHKWIYPSISDHYYRVALPEGAKRVEVSATDRFGRISRAAADLK